MVGCSWTGTVVSLAIVLVTSLVPLELLRSAGMIGRIVDAQRPTTRGRLSVRLSDALVGAQIAIAVVLLVGAGLLLASFRNVMAVDPGFGAERVVRSPRLQHGPDVLPVARRRRRVEAAPVARTTTQGRSSSTNCSRGARSGTSVQSAWNSRRRSRRCVLRLSAYQGERTSADPSKGMPNPSGIDASPYEQGGGSTPFCCGQRETQSTCPGTCGRHSGPSIRAYP